VKKESFTLAGGSLKAPAQVNIATATAGVAQNNSQSRGAGNLSAQTA